VPLIEASFPSGTTGGALAEKLLLQVAIINDRSVKEGSSTDNRLKTEIIIKNI